MASIVTPVANDASIAAGDLWQILSGFDAFSTFNDHERESFQHAFDHEHGMRVRSFPAGTDDMPQG